MLSKVEAASDRLKAKIDLTEHYSRILNIVSQIEMAEVKKVEDAREFMRKNAMQRRREAVEMSESQKSTLRQHEIGIKDCFARIAETEKAISECKRVLDGEDPFAVLADQIAERLDKVRGSRAAAA